jgi:endo-1,4-beta-xylanase
MNRLLAATFRLIATLMLFGCAKVPPPPPPAPIICNSLAACATEADILIGTSVVDVALSSDLTYAKLLASEFSAATPENAMKFEIIHPEQDIYNFEQADRIVDYAQTHGLAIRGHTLVWHRQLPAWLTEREWDKYELTLVLITHIQKIVGQYRGQVLAWDVVNEAFNSDGSYRDTLWYRVIGPEYIEIAFRAAHTADPDALLFYNDFDAERINQKSTAIFEAIQAMLDKGVPIHGIGLQAHFRPENMPSGLQISQNMKHFAKLGLDIHITEMDVALASNEPQALNSQAQAYRDVIYACLGQANCKLFSVWGLADHVSWVPQHFEGLNAPLLFDSAYQPKPAYDAVLAALRRGRPQPLAPASEAESVLYQQYQTRQQSVVLEAPMPQAPPLPPAAP